MIALSKHRNLMKKHKNDLFLFIVLSTSISLYYYCVMSVNCIDNALIIGVGSYVSLDGYDVMRMIIGVLFYLCIIFIFSKDFATEFNRASIYMFSRYRDRTVWLLRYIRSTLLRILFVWLLISAIFTIVGVILSKHLSEDFICIFLCNIALQFFASLFFILFCFILTLLVKANAAYILTALLYLVSLIICVPLYDKQLFSIMKVLPSSHAIYAWHNVSLAGMDDMGIIGISDLKLIHSMIYYSILIIIEFYILLIIIKKMDLLNLEDY